MKRFAYFLLFLIFLTSSQTLVSISADNRLWSDFTHYWNPDPQDSNKHFRVGQNYYLEARLLDENSDPIRDEIVEVIVQRPDVDVNRPYITEGRFTGITNDYGVARVEVMFDTDELYLVTVNWNGNDEYRGGGSAFDIYVEKGGGFDFPLYGLGILGLGLILLFWYRRRTSTP